MGPRDSFPDELLANDLAVVVVDARGTGASEGRWEHMWSNAEIDDYRQVVDWVVAQEWSNGRVAATGISYEGSTAMLLASLNHPAVCAVTPREFEYDLYNDIIAPGGVQNEIFLRMWSQMNSSLDSGWTPWDWGLGARIFIKGPHGVDEDPKRKQLQAIIKQRENPEVWPCIKNVECRDDEYGGQPGITGDSLSVRSKADGLRRSNVPAQVYGSFMDGTTARSALAMFAELPSVREVVLGAFTHEGNKGASLGHQQKQANEPLAAQWSKMIHFMKTRLLLGDEEREEPERRVRFFSMGADRWHESPVWPPAGAQMATYFLSNHSKLVADEASVNSIVITSHVNLNATTGKKNRWYTQLAKPIEYGDRRGAESNMVVFRTPAFEATKFLTGEVDVRLQIEVSSPRAVVIAYLELEEPSGYVHYITEGMLQARFRTSSSGFRRADIAESEDSVVSSGPFEMSLTLLPTSVQVNKGQKLRLGLAHCDKHSFPGKDPNASFKVHCPGSFIALPLYDEHCPRGRE